MDPIERLAEALDTLPLVVRQAVVGIVQTFTQELLDYNRNYLQKQGQRPDGELLQAGGYSPAYASFKKKYGRFTNTDFVDLKFSGAYLEAFALNYIGGLRFEVQNDDEKATTLAKRYGELLGIREEDLLLFVTELVEPEVRQVIIQHMQLAR